MANFGERIKELRKQRGLTQRQMADTFGITERNYQRYEATESPSNETLIKLADFFEVTTDFLLGRTDYNYRLNADGDVVVKPPVDFQSVLDLDTTELQRRLDNADHSHKLKFLFEEPLQSYAEWLRKVGIPISGGGNTGRVVVEIEEDDFFDITDNLGVILQMSKEQFRVMVRQLGKTWPEK